jgi:7-cyano-7-deazaguanine synthase
MSNSLVLLSGGPDSATLVAWAKNKGHSNLKALYLLGGHATDKMEIASADSIAAEVGAQLEIMDVTQMVSALGGQRVLIHSEASIMPFGNAIVLSMAVTYALRIKANSILIALHADDAAESDEYTRGFIDQIEHLAQWTQGDINILTPFINMRKSEVFQMGYELGVDYSKTWSCVRPGELHCGYCGACRARAKAFNILGKKDPTEYEQPVLALSSIPAGR